ncbi:lipoprotein [Arthrobacter sp. ZBG10]|uniref:DUF305 domain-containing protein n=1 Tax=Arthrobacter sp. ZBG10 TaxID=1676590 RepID=UPI0006803741|nr:DUF305 domain-containing protein [Arthrobacter sp. ZBG10]KNH16275.1 lipoprotein [Arthrobacter sp. ZBG10]
MNTKLLTLSAAALAATVALAGCSTGSAGPTVTPSSSTSPKDSMHGMDHGSSMMPSSSPAAAAEHNAADTMFAQMMIPHHEQAVEMSDMMLKKQDIPAQVTSLASKIKAAQGPEIEKMTGWLTNWNEPAMAPSGHAMGGGMDGMMGDDDMKELAAAQGADAAKLFLTQMIAHHEGAVTMAKTETTAGKNPEAVQLSRDITTSQEAEIQEMKDLLAAL